MSTESQADTPPVTQVEFPETGVPQDPSPNPLPATAGVGAVHLAVTNASLALEFYRDAVGLTPLSVSDGEIRLGAGSRELVVLYPGADGPVEPHRTGLYHLALLVPDRRELARAVARLGSLGVDNYPTDHTMTKSTYLWDHDGNGIEIYCESPEDGSWYMTEDTFAAKDRQGRMRSGRDPIDLRELFGHLAPDDDVAVPLPVETKMGHVHLHVRDIDEAVRFYRDVIGFDVMGMARRFGAAFVSAGGYHHHVGLNTWAGQGIPPAPAGVAGLRHFTVEVPTKEDISLLAGRLRAAGVEVSGDDNGFFTVDPSRNRMKVTSSPA